MDQIKSAGLTVKEAELTYVAAADVPVEDSEKILKLMDAIDDLDDVVNVHTNAEL